MSREDDPTTQRQHLAPEWIRRLGAVSWPIAVAGVVVWGFASLVSTLTPVVVPLAVALLLTGVLHPAVRRLERPGWPSWLVPLIAVLTLLGVLVGIVTVAGARLADEWPQLQDEFESSLADLEERFSITLPDIPGADPSSGSSSDSSSDSASGSGSGNDVTTSEAAQVFTVGSTILFGIFLALALTFLFLKDGAWIWAWIVDRVPRSHRRGVDDVGRSAWSTVGGYVRGLTVVALFDALGIGLGLLLLGVPLVLTLAVLQFVLSYVPTIGAFVAGAVAVVVALGSEGLVTAALVLALVVLVQQLGNDVIEPWVMDRMIGLHPVMVLVAVTAGAVLWGIAGALLFVPLAAALAAAVTVLWERRGAVRDADARG